MEPRTDLVLDLKTRIIFKRDNEADEGQQIQEGQDLIDKNQRQSILPPGTRKAKRAKLDKHEKCQRIQRSASHGEVLTLKLLSTNPILRKYRHCEMHKDTCKWRNKQIS